MASTKKKSHSPRQAPPAFPMGFKIMASDDICIVDFLHMDDADGDNGHMSVFCSLALTKKTASQLIGAISSFVESEGDE